MKHQAGPLHSGVPGFLFVRHLEVAMLEVLLVLLILGFFGGGHYYPGPAVYGDASLFHVIAVVLVIILIFRLLHVGL